MTPRVTRLQPIRPYVGPSYLIEPLEPIHPNDMASEIESVNDASPEYLDRVIGWGPYNAIVATDGRYYLATIKP